MIVLVLGIMTWVLPSWPALGMVAAVVVITALVAGIPLGAIPRPPWWFWGLIGIGVAFNVSFAGIPGALVFLARSLSHSSSSRVRSSSSGPRPWRMWRPALARLMRPLRWFRLPVDEWAVAIALCLRGLPLLIEERACCGRHIDCVRRPRDVATTRRRRWGSWI